MANTTKQIDVPVKDGTILRLSLGVAKIFAGAAVGLIKATGYVVKIAANNPPMRFIGVAVETVDNSAGSAGDKFIKVQRKGIWKFGGGSGFTVADIGKNVYFSDDQTVTLTANNMYAGRLVQVDGEGAFVDIEPALQNVRLKTVALQPQTLAAAGTARDTRYRVPAGAVAYIQAGSYGYSVKPNFATTCVLILSKLVATVRTTLLSTANIDVNNVAPAVDTPTALTLASAAVLALGTGDEVEAAVTGAGAFTAGGDTHVHLEVLEIGGSND